MKRTWPVLVAAASGVFVILALILQPQLAGYLPIVLNWAIVISSMALLVALAILLLAHLRKLKTAKRGLIYTLVLLFSFGLSLGGGLWLGVDHPGYLQWMAGIQKPLEISLLGLLALVMTSGTIQVFRQRGWSPLTVAFGLSAFVFLILGLGFLQALKIPELDVVIVTLQQLPLIGARGLLIGIALGAVLMGLRVLVGLERPFEG